MRVISALWSEFVLRLGGAGFLLIGPRLVRLLTPGGAMAVAAVAGIVRWTVADFTSSPVILAFVQPLHGFTFALLHLAAGAGDRASGADPFGCNGTSQYTARCA